MKTFLETVAHDIITKHGTDLSRTAVVFPNKRASLFLNEHLARLADRPLWSPAYITISDLFRRHSKLATADPIKLICDLHKSFVACTGLNETLDHFYGWGQLLLSDFDDIDKNMADAAKVFANLRDIHEFDDASFLTEEQKEMLKKFFSNFSDDHNSELKRRFLELWSHFGDIFNDYNQRLGQQGLAYEGKLYREVVENPQLTFEYDTYLFVGFNMMQKVELALCDRLKREGKARFYWDYDHYYMSGDNEAGHYIRQYLAHYPNEIAPDDAHDPYDNLRRTKDITYISASTENIQARYISTWLRENNRIADGSRTAIVMADESLLQTVVHCLPPEVKDVNITTGYPLQQSPFFSLVMQLFALCTMGYQRQSNRYRLHFVNRLLRHPYTPYVSSKYRDLIDDLNRHKRFYPARDSLTLGDEGLELLFPDMGEFDNRKLIGWMLAVLKRIGVNARGVADPLFQESLFRSYTLLNRLKELMDAGDLTVDTATLERLTGQLFQSTGVPFHGEPVVGIQVMGVLETRNLDFDHVLLLSANEGNLPKGINDASFIPYSIRHAYGLTTIDNKVAIYAYYFYSLIQRATDVTMTYNNATEDGHTGEMSRFMLQLMVESGHPIVRRSLQAGQEPKRKEETDITKDKAVEEQLNRFTSLSPTAINTYLRCQKRFFYRYIAHIEEPDTPDEDAIDNRIFGNIFHKACQNIYLSFAGPGDVACDEKGEPQLLHPLTIRQGDIDSYLKSKMRIEEVVDDAFREELFHVKRQGFRPEYNGLQLINRNVIVSYVRQLLRLDSRHTPFTILGLELKVFDTVTFTAGSAERTLQIGGSIDRLDAVASELRGERIRVIDYKTGNKAQAKIKTIEEIFSGEDISRKHTDYYLQTMLYSLIVDRSSRHNPEGEPVSPALLFIQHTTGDEYDPTLTLGDEKITSAGRYRDEFTDRLKGVLTDIFDLSHPFVATADRRHCDTCPYRQICK